MLVIHQYTLHSVMKKWHADLQRLIVWHYSAIVSFVVTLSHASPASKPECLLYKVSTIPGVNNT